MAVAALCRKLGAQLIIGVDVGPERLLGKVSQAM